MTPYEEIMHIVQDVECAANNNTILPLTCINVIVKKHKNLLLSTFMTPFIEACRDDYQSWTILQKQEKWEFLQRTMFSSTSNK